MKLFRGSDGEAVEFTAQVPAGSEIGQMLSIDKYSARSETSGNGVIKKYHLSKDGIDLEYREVLALWEHDEEFLGFYVSIFKQCGFESYIWETPPVSSLSLNQKFEFVLIDTAKPLSIPDHDTFRDYFDPNSQGNGVVVFPNLGHDALLVVPSPLTEDANYSGLAEFCSESPVPQQYSLWKSVAKEIGLKLSGERLWVSVAGGGVSWLHIRIDSAPKYYRYSPYSTHF